MVTTTKKPSSKASVGAAANPVPAATKAHHATHPSWTDMIKECITAHPEEARSGVSRPTIKKYVEATYHVEPNASTNNHLARAITVGVEKGIFVLPKGPAGKVKLPSKGHKETTTESAPAVLKRSTTVNKSETDADNSVPAKAKMTAKKSAGKKTTAAAKVPAKKSAAAAKITTAKAASAKKAAATSRRTAVAKKGTAGSRAASTRKRGSVKRGVTGKFVATKAKKPRAKTAAAKAKAGKAPEATVEKAKPGRKPASKKAQATV